MLTNGDNEGKQSASQAWSYLFSVYLRCLTSWITREIGSLAGWLRLRLPCFLSRMIRLLVYKGVRSEDESPHRRRRAWCAWPRCSASPFFLGTYPVFLSTTSSHYPSYFTVLCFRVQCNDQSSPPLPDTCTLFSAKFCVNLLMSNQAFYPVSRASGYQETGFLIQIKKKALRRTCVAVYHGVNI